MHEDNLVIAIAIQFMAMAYTPLNTVLPRPCLIHAFVDIHGPNFSYLHNEILFFNSPSLSLWPSHSYCCETSLTSVVMDFAGHVRFEPALMELWIIYIILCMIP